VRIEGDTDANLFYTDATNSRVGVGLTNPTEKFEVVGNIKLSGNVIPANGFGVDFAATSGTGTSELLADYEEGDWTPVLSTTGSAPTISGYTAQVGKYTKVGNLVTVSCYIRATVTAIGTGDVTVSGLPFTVGANTFNGPALGITNLLAVLGAYKYANPASTQVIFEGSTLSLTPNTYLTFSLTYPV